MPKQRSPQKVVKNLLLLREELARWNVDYVSKVIVGKIDTCLYGEYKLHRKDDRDEQAQLIKLRSGDDNDRDNQD